MKKDNSTKELRERKAYVTADLAVIEATALQMICLSSTETDDLVNDPESYIF